MMMTENTELYRRKGFSVGDPLLMYTIRYDIGEVNCGIAPVLGREGLLRYHFTYIVKADITLGFQFDIRQLPVGENSGEYYLAHFPTSDEEITLFLRDAVEFLCKSFTNLRALLDWMQEYAEDVTERLNELANKGLTRASVRPGHDDLQSRDKRYSLLTQSECHTIRDALYNAMCNDGNALFRAVAVIADKSETIDADIYVSPFIIGDDVDIPRLVLEKIAVVSEGKYQSRKFAVHRREYDYYNWDIDWSQTAKSDADNIPVFIGIEENGTLTGAYMQDSRLENTRKAILDGFSSRESAEELIARIREMGLYERFGAFYKVDNISGDSIDSVVDELPYADDGKKHFILFRDNDWFYGAWNKPTMEIPHPENVSLVNMSIALSR